VIHFLNELRASQIARFQLGEKLSAGDGAIFSQAAVKAALPPVSKVRLEQTLYAEYPTFKRAIERLRQRKSRYKLSELQQLWNMPEKESVENAEGLEEIGFFEKAGHLQWRIPLLYRPALDLDPNTFD
jgi:hypothetical protein